MVAVAAPALAAGPPGWVVFALAVVGTAAVGALTMSQSSSQSRTRSPTRTRDVTMEDCPPPPRPWSVRVHAQGTDVGGTSGSTIGAPPIVQTSGPVSAGQGVALAGATFALLGARQQRNLAPAYEKCVQFIETRPPLGFLGKKSHYGASRDNNRFDVDSFGPSPNFIA